MIGPADNGRLGEGWRERLQLIEEAATGNRPAEDLHGVLDLVLRHVSEFLDVVGAATWLFDEDEEMWYVAVSQGFTPEAWAGVRFRSGTALPCRVGERGEPLLVEDIDEVDFHRMREEHYRVRSAIYAPMFLGRRTVGVLAVYSDRVGAYTQDDLDFLAAVGDHLGVAVAFSVMEERARRIAVLEERDRQARDLHDGISQVLCSLRAWALEADAAVAAGEVLRGRRLIEEIRSTIDEADAEVRESIASLRQSSPLRDVFDVLARMRQRLDAAGIGTTLDVGAAWVPQPQSDALAWIVREATNNVLKHSEASKVRIELAAAGDQVLLVVEDDGTGIVPGTARRDGAHIGLAVMEERAARLGGQLTVKGLPGEGTRLECRVPLTPNA